MRIVVLAGEQPNQLGLCHKLGREVELRGVVWSRNRSRARSRHRVQTLLNRLAGRTLGLPLLVAWNTLQARYASDYGALDCQQVRVDNINDRGTAEALARWAPDLVLVSGTNLIGRSLCARAQQLAPRGIINLHTGLSPYVKGGPNCTNWCLAEDRFEWIGATVMWLDAGIDTGPLLTTEQTPLDGSESLAELHWRVMEHAHDLYRRAVCALRDGLAVARLEQSELGTGRTYYSWQWSAAAMARALHNFTRHYSPAGLRTHVARSAALRLVPLPLAGASPA